MQTLTVARFGAARAIAARLSIVLAAALGCACAQEPPPSGPARGEIVEMVPSAIRAVTRSNENGCDYSWLSLSGQVDGDLTTVFMPIRRNLGAEPRCQPKLANEVAMLVEAEIADGDREPLRLCVKKHLVTPGIEVPDTGRRYEAIELVVSGWYFRKEVFWSCDDEPGCDPPPSCNILDAGPG